MTEKTKRVGVPWVKCDCHGPLEIIRTLTRDQAWAFMVIEKLIYHTEDRLRDDDKEMAHKMRCDVRTYRRLKNELLDAGVMAVEDGRVTITHASGAVADAVAAYTKVADARRGSRARPDGDRDGSRIKLVRNTMT